MKNVNTHNLSHSLLTLCSLVTSLNICGLSAIAADGYSLVFDTNKFTVKTLTVGTQAVTYRTYEGIVYVANPVDTTYQSLFENAVRALPDERA